MTHTILTKVGPIRVDLPDDQPSVLGMIDQGTGDLRYYSVPQRMTEKRMGQFCAKVQRGKVAPIGKP